MKLETTQREIHKSEDFKESLFGIKSNSDLVHIFSILRNKIYTDKVLAVVREYATNAADAHIENGCPNRPIEIHLPSILEPFFSIRDYGRGLSEDDIRNIYAMYGCSTKRDSNAFNGQLGLGGKAAFSYTDSFQITSINNGIKTTYDAYIDASGIGSIAKLTSSATDEESGVEISVPVAQKDIDAFVDRATETYTHFQPRPIVRGHANFEMLEPIEDFGFFRLCTRHRVGADKYPINSYVQYGYKHYGVHTNYGQFYARMGNVLYPIAHEYNRIIFDYLNMDHQNYVVIDFEIGELSIAASREQLEDTEKTKQAVTTKIAQIKDILADRVAKLFSECHSLQDYYESFSKDSQIFNKKSFPAIYRLFLDQGIYADGSQYLTPLIKFKYNALKPNYEVLKTKGLAAIGITYSGCSVEHKSYGAGSKSYYRHQNEKAAPRPFRYCDTSNIETLTDVVVDIEELANRNYHSDVQAPRDLVIISHVGNKRFKASNKDFIDGLDRYAASIAPKVADGDDRCHSLNYIILYGKTQKAIDELCELFILDRTKIISMDQIIPDLAAIEAKRKADAKKKAKPKSQGLLGADLKDAGRVVWQSNDVILRIASGTGSRYAGITEKQAQSTAKMIASINYLLPDSEPKINLYFVKGKSEEDAWKSLTKTPFRSYSQLITNLVAQNPKIQMASTILLLPHKETNYLSTIVPQIVAQRPNLYAPEEWLIIYAAIAISQGCSDWRDRKYTFSLLGKSDHVELENLLDRFKQHMPLLPHIPLYPPRLMEDYVKLCLDARLPLKPEIKDNV